MSAREPLVTRSFAPLSARICVTCGALSSGLTGTWISPARAAASGIKQASRVFALQLATRSPGPPACASSHRSEEHTSELQSLMRISYAVLCLQNKNNQPTTQHKQYTQN